MLKKLLTGCLTIAMAAALAVPAMAAEVTGKVGGRAVADLSSVSVTPQGGADGYSYMDMAAQGRIDYKLTATEGDWSFSGKVEYRSNTSHDAYVSPVVLQKFFTLENDAFAVSLGTQWFGFVYLTPYMGVTDAWDRACYGCADLRSDRAIVKIKSVGLDILYGANMNNGDATADAYQISELGLQYNGAFGPVAVAAQYLSQAYAAVENLDQSTDKSTMDGYTLNEMAFAVRYGISEAMFVEFDYNSLSTKMKDVDAKNTITMGLAFAMAFSEAQGIAVAWDQAVADSGTSDADDDTTKTTMTFTFNQKIAGQQLFFGYNNILDHKKDVDDGVKTVMAFGGRVNF
jgi:hypothetical protein